MWLPFYAPNSCFWHPGARFTNGFLPEIQIRRKLRLVIIPLLAIRSQQIFAHATTAQLSCHVQNFVAITIFKRIEVRVKRNFHRVWIAMEKPLVKRCPSPHLFSPFIAIHTLVVYSPPIQCVWRYGHIPAHSGVRKIAWCRATHIYIREINEKSVFHI